jgi:protein-S-isoprenylcysteine O-methyltransferase Ste14
MDDGYENLILDDEDEYKPEPQPTGWPPGALTSGASAIAALTLAVAGLMGWIGYPVAEALVGPADRPGDMRELAAVGAMVVLLVLLGAFWLSHRVVSDDDEVPAWARDVALGAVVVAAVGAALSIVTIVANLLSRSSTL